MKADVSTFGNLVSGFVRSYDVFSHVLDNWRFTAFELLKRRRLDAPQIGSS